MTESSRSVTRAAGLSSGALASADDFGAAGLLVERLEDCIIFTTGPCVKHLRFFRDLEAAAFCDEGRTAWRALTHWLAQSISGGDDISDTVRDKVAALLYEAGGGAGGGNAAKAIAGHRQANREQHAVGALLADP